ncbi:MAG: hypothetical protein KGJ09_04205 [Candidatus Omnitrophica bacterium]|nr:hypothetical protein [Candidatus Omnitrophota bacterium]MDE2009264.1 hypothetical protein [Candidatus Omnitrophota bacterium]
MPDGAIEARYRTYVDGLLLRNVRFIAVVAIVVHLVFNILDRVTYPSLAGLFLNIRIIDSLLTVVLLLILIPEKMKPRVIYISDILGTLFAGGIILMIFFADGSASRYYEGINLVFLGFGVLNPYYTKHNILCFLLWLGLYNLAVVFNHHSFDRVNFAFANLFMGSTALFVVIWTKFYSIQHRQSFMRQEQLKLSEANLLEDIARRERAESELKKAYEDLKSVQSQLIQSEKMASIGQLAAGVAHEINNPLGFIGNNTELLAQYVSEYTKILRMLEIVKKNIQEGDVQKAKSIIEEIDAFEKEIQLDYIMNDVDNLLQHNQRGIERIQKIVMDLKTFAHEGSDNMDLIKIEEVMDSVINIVYNELKYKAELKKDYGPTPMVKGNPQRMGQVFINLLVNAAQAIEGMGVIEVRTYVRDKYVCVEVTDTGKGIKEEHLKKIFEPFFTTKPVGKGTGLGLSVSYEIIKKHKGEINVRSKPGEGTTFTVMLPAGV